MNYRPKLLMLACILGLMMAFVSSGYAEDAGTPATDAQAMMLDAAPAPVMDAAPVAAPVAAEDIEVPLADEPAPEKQTALSKLSQDLMNILIPAFMTAIGLLVTWVLDKLRRKFHLEVSDGQMDAWARLADRAAARGAEWARNKLKTATDGKTVPGNEILEVAADWAVEMGRMLKLPELGREKLVGLIESNLHFNRIDPDHPMELEIPVEEEPEDDKES